MTTFELISTNQSGGEGASPRAGQILNIHALRTLLFVTILCVSVIFQVSQDQFINTGVWIPVYLILLSQFFINGVYLFNFERFKNFYYSDSVVLAIDAVIITALIFYSGISQSIFIFLYLINIIFTGMIYQRRGAMLMALWTSILLSTLLIFSPGIEGQSLYFAMGLNNVAFFAVALLSGLLSEHLSVMGKSIAALKDLNQLIVENVGTGLLTIDARQKITYANRAAAIALDDLGLIEKTLHQILPGLSEKIIEGQVKKGRPFRFDEQILNFRGETLHLSTVVSSLQVSEKQNNTFVVMFQDITQVKRLEYQMRQQEKMAAVGQLAAGIAHEIRNPLASISGSIQLMSASTDGITDENKQLMRIVLREIDRLNDLISEFLDFVRPVEKSDTPVDLNRIVTEVLEMIRLNKNMRAGIGQKSSLLSTHLVRGHADKLKQALLNIVINAYQAMEKTGAPEFFVETKDLDGQVVLTIRDNGTGMEEKNLRRIFEPFHTTKAKGTGLGLAITHKILENHEAKVFVESEPGRGTSFTIQFPRVEDLRHQA